MKHNQIYFREFPDGDYELGILEDKGTWWMMDVDDFAYSFSLDLSKWTLIGEL